MIGTKRTTYQCLHINFYKTLYGTMPDHKKQTNKTES